MIPWPSLIPRSFLVSGYSQSLKPNAIVAEPEVGEAMTRVRFTGDVEDVAGKMMLDREELLIFMRFFKYDLKFGALSFSWDHPIYQTAAVCNFLGRPPKIVPITTELFEAALEVQFKNE
jgi:hypothetical protein